MANPVAASSPKEALPSKWSARGMRRWLRFSLRAMLLVVLLSAVACTWRRAAWRKRQEEAAIKSFGGKAAAHELREGTAWPIGLHVRAVRPRMAAKTARRRLFQRHRELAPFARRRRRPQRISRSRTHPGVIDPRPGQLRRVWQRPSALRTRNYGRRARLRRSGNRLACADYWEPRGHRRGA